MNKNTNPSAQMRIFKNPILNSISHTSLMTVNIIYIPVIIYFLLQSFNHYPLLVNTLGLALGLVVWSFVEYITHRFTFHFKVQNARLKYLHSIFHFMHHDYPNDKAKYQALLIITLPTAILYYYLLKWIFGTLCEPIFAGFIIGYVLYEFAHFSTHKFNMQNKLTKALKHNHMRHHYFDNTKNFGVTSPLWDYVFNTYLNQTQMRESINNT
jgi:sterol desaturase/sphingolipid hydroxylase (fatty acid hydroxylase superfamily)